MSDYQLGFDRGCAWGCGLSDEDLRVAIANRERTAQDIPFNKGYTDALRQLLRTRHD